MKKNTILILLYVGCLAATAAFFFARSLGGSADRNPVLLAGVSPT